MLKNCIFSYSSLYSSITWFSRFLRRVQSLKLRTIPSRNTGYTANLGNVSFEKKYLKR